MVIMAIENRAERCPDFGSVFAVELQCEDTAHCPIPSIAQSNPSLLLPDRRGAEQACLPPATTVTPPHASASVSGLYPVVGCDPSGEHLETHLSSDSKLFFCLSGLQLSHAPLPPGPAFLAQGWSSFLVPP